jgi:zinc protease
MKRVFLLPIVIAVLITGQLSCSKTSHSKTPAEREQEQAAIDEILKRYEEALGGRAAIDSIKSYKMSGRFAIANLTGNIEGWRKEPHKTLTVIEFPGHGVLKKGFDGETRWLQTPMGTFTDDDAEEEIAQLERDAEVFSAGKIKSLFYRMKLENKARLSGREVHVIEGEPERGPAEKLFFDTESGLLVRWDMARKNPKRGTVFVKVHLDDYKDVDGVKIPFKVRFAFESFNFVVQVDKLENNIQIDDAIFKKP